MINHPFRCGLTSFPRGICILVFLLKFRRIKSLVCPEPRLMYKSESLSDSLGAWDFLTPDPGIQNVLARQAFSNEDYGAKPPRNSPYLTLRIRLETKQFLLSKLRWKSAVLYEPPLTAVDYKRSYAIGRTRCKIMGVIQRYIAISMRTSRMKNSVA